MNKPSLAQGRAFIIKEGRILEQRLAEVVFDGAPATPVVDALRAYQNDNGGFGHGLEPDKLSPESQPLDVEVALRVLTQAGTNDAAMTTSACDWLDSVAAPDGGVPLVFPTITNHPRAVHWGDGEFPPGLNPTAGLAGLLHELDVDHPWRDRATEYTWNRLDAGDFTDAHTLLEVSVFLDRVPDQTRAETFAAGVVEQLAKAEYFHLEPRGAGYGVTPLWFAPRPSARWGELFGQPRMEGHLDWMADLQQDDGGWPIEWEPPSTAATMAYRAVQTLSALRTLQAYNRL